MFLKRCRLCLKTIEDTSYVLIEDFTRNMLETLIPLVKLDNNVTPKICQNCARFLEASYQLKAIWLENNERIKKIIVDKKVQPKTNMMLCCLCGYYVSEVMTEDERIRLNKMIEISIPELDIYYECNVGVCKRCVSDLARVYIFVCNILQVEEKTKDLFSDTSVELNLKFENRVKEEYERSYAYEDSTNSKPSRFNSLVELQSTNPEVNIDNTVVKNELVKKEVLWAEDIKQGLNQQNVPNEYRELSDIACASNFEDYFIKTKTSDGPVSFKCDFCPFAAKYKGNLKVHSLVHKKNSETTLFECFDCGFATKHKPALKMHIMLKHKPSQMPLFECHTCGFRAKLKGNLKSHVLAHMDPKKMLMHKCEYCGFETKYQTSLKTHMRRHKNEFLTVAVKKSLCEN